MVYTQNSTLYPLQSTDHLTNWLARHALFAASCQICYPTALLNANKKPEALNKCFLEKLVVEGRESTIQRDFLFDAHNLCFQFLCNWVCCRFSGIVVLRGAPSKPTVKRSSDIQTLWLESHTRGQTSSKWYWPTKQTNGTNHRRVGSRRQYDIFYFFSLAQPVRAG